MSFSIFHSTLYSMDWFIAFNDAHPYLFYLVAFVGMFIEGDIMLLILGALSKEKYVSFTGMFLVAFVATMVHDIIFWKIGKKLGKLKKKKYLYFDITTFTSFLQKMSKHAGLFIIFSKFAWNFNRIVIVALGYISTPLKKLVRYSLVSSMLWPLSYMSIGYIFAEETDIFRQRIEIVGLLVLGIIVLIILFEMYIKKIVFKFFGSDKGIGDSFSGDCKE